MNDDNLRPMSKAELEAYIADDFIPTMRKMLPAIAPLPEWQPIETAPRDGQRVYIRAVMYYDHDAKGWAYFHDQTTTAMWMPLPKPPTA